MSVKSALAKNWLNFDRRVYIDKQTNQEMPFSQAVDMDLLVLIANIPEDTPNQVSNNVSQLGNNTLLHRNNDNNSDYGSITHKRSTSRGRFV